MSQRLHEASGQYELLFDNATVGGLTRSLAGEIIRANPAACRELGYAEQELGDVWYLVRVYPAPEGVTLYHRDISERKELEAALAHKEGQVVVE